METAQFRSLDELWSSVAFGRLDPDTILGGSGFHLRTWIKHIDGGQESVYLTYAPDMGRDRVVAGLIVVGKGRGSMCVPTLRTIPSADKGESELPDGRTVEWGTRTISDRTGSPLGPASGALWRSKDGEACVIDGSLVSAEFLLDAVAQLAEQDGG